MFLFIFVTWAVTQVVNGNNFYSYQVCETINDCTTVKYGPKGINGCLSWIKLMNQMRFEGEGFVVFLPYEDVYMKAKQS
jgi:hypothetical protein